MTDVTNRPGSYKTTALALTFVAVIVAVVLSLPARAILRRRAEAPELIGIPTGEIASRHGDSLRNWRQAGAAIFRNDSERTIVQETEERYDIRSIPPTEAGETTMVVFRRKAPFWQAPWLPPMIVYEAGKNGSPGRILPPEEFRGNALAPLP
jgi:hypothetical protein